jgi:hypothetical protein
MNCGIASAGSKEGVGSAKVLAEAEAPSRRSFSHEQPELARSRETIAASETPLPTLPTEMAPVDPAESLPEVYTDRAECAESHSASSLLNARLNSGDVDHEFELVEAEDGNLLGAVASPEELMARMERKCILDPCSDSDEMEELRRQRTFVN